MQRVAAAVFLVCLLSISSAQMPGMFPGFPGGSAASLLPAMLSRGGGGGGSGGADGALGMLLLSLLNQQQSGVGGGVGSGVGGGAGGSSSLMPLLMMMRGASPSEIMPLLMLTQGQGGASGLANNPMLLMSLMQGSDQMARLVPLLLMQQQQQQQQGAGGLAGLPNGSSQSDASNQPSNNVAPLLLSGAIA